MFRCKAFLHLYRAEGVDEDQFKEAANNMDNLIEKYKNLWKSLQICMGN